MYKSFDTRDDYSREDVEDYFNYMGMLASEVGGRAGCTHWFGAWTAPTGAAKRAPPPSHLPSRRPAALP